MTASAAAAAAEAYALKCLGCRFVGAMKAEQRLRAGFLGRVHDADATEALVIAAAVVVVIVVVVAAAAAKLAVEEVKS